MIAPLFTIDTLIWIYIFSFIQTFGKIYAVYVLFNLHPGNKLWRVWLTSVILNCIDFIFIDILRIPFNIAMIISVIVVIICSKWLYRLPKTQALIIGIALPTVQSSIQAIFTGLLIHYQIFDHADFIAKPVALYTIMSIGGGSLLLIYGFLYSKNIYLEVLEGKGRNKRLELAYVLVLTLTCSLYQLNLFFLPNDSKLVFSLVLCGLMSLFFMYKMNRDMLYKKYRNYRSRKKCNEITLHTLDLEKE